MENVNVILRASAETQHTDGQLLERFASARDEGAFAELVSRHGPMVLAACRRVLGNKTEAYDAFQATFLVLAQKAASIRDTRTLAGWLYGVARHAAVRKRDSECRRRKHELLAVPPESVDWEALAAVDEELERLPDHIRLPLIACILEEQTQEDAARSLGIGLSTLRRRIARGLDILRGRLAVSLTGMGGAFISQTLATETAQHAATFVLGEHAAGAALAKGVLNMMVRANLKSTATLVAALGLTCGIGIVVAQQPDAPRVETVGIRARENNNPPKPGVSIARLQQTLAELEREIAQLERELIRLEVERDALKKKMKTLPATDNLLDQDPQVRALAKRREAAWETLKRAEDIVPNSMAPVILKMKDEIQRLDKDLETLRNRIRPTIVEAGRERFEHRLSDIENMIAEKKEVLALRMDYREAVLKRMVGMGDAQSSNLRMELVPMKEALHKLELEVFRLRVERELTSTQPASPGATDAKLDQVLKELKELRQDLEALKKSR